MRSAISLAAGLICWLAGSSTHSQDAVALKWDFTAEKTFYQELVSETEQSIKGSDLSFRQKQTHSLYLKWTSKGRTPKGDLVLIQRIEAVKFRTEIGDNIIERDSTAKNSPHSTLTQFFEALATSDLKITLNKDNKVTKVEDINLLTKKLFKVSPGFEAISYQILSEQIFKQMCSLIQLVPLAPIKKADQWKTEETCNFGPLGCVKMVHHNSYAGLAPDGLHKFTFKTTGTIEPPNPKQDGGLPFTFKSGSLPVTDSGGVFLFDSKQGLMPSFAQRVKIEGKLDLVFDQKPSQFIIVQTQTRSIRTGLQSFLPKS